MRISNDTKQAVNPYAIATTRFRRPGVIAPNIWRPVLFTDRLRGLHGGCGCADCSTLGVPSGSLGLIIDQGGADVISGDISQALHQAKSFWQSLEAALGIGAGRREADVITPIQNKITSDVLAPAAQMRAEVGQHVCQEYRLMLGLIVKAHDEFKGFLTTTQWQDGRAAQQALVWLDGPLPASATNPSWFHQVRSDFEGTTNQVCAGQPGGGGPILPGTGGTGGSSGLTSSVMLPLLLGGAMFLLRR